MKNNFCVKFRSEASLNGYPIQDLKSAIQKYARRGNYQKGLHALLEFNTFKELEDKNSIYYKESGLTNDNVIRKIRTNMMNRLIVMVSEDVGIAEWWVPELIQHYYDDWDQNRVGKQEIFILAKIYQILSSTRKLRLISDLKTAFILPPYYGKREDQSKYHHKLFKTCPNLKKVIDKITIRINSSKNLLNLFETLLKEKNIGIFWLMSHQFETSKSFGWKTYWSIVISEAECSRHESLIDQVEALKSFFNKMTHKEKPIYLYHAILMIIYQDKFNWKVNNPPTQINTSEVQNLYQRILNGHKIKFDDFVYDLHSSNNITKDDQYSKFAQEGAHVENERIEFLIPEYRLAYYEFKKILDQKHITDKDKLPLSINAINKEVVDLANLVGIQVISLSENDSNIHELKLTKAPQCQLRTGYGKKIVKIISTYKANMCVAVKGPYNLNKPEDKSKLILNFKNTYAMRLLEKQWGKKYHSTLKINNLIILSNQIAYFSSTNMGNPDKMETEIKTSKLESNVKVIKRGTMIRRISEFEDKDDTPKEILIAVLHHLYLRYLFDIGDSGTHNILEISNPEYKSKSVKLIIGNDLEEMRANLNPKTKLEALFRRVSKKIKKVYTPLLDQISPLKITPEMETKLQNLSINSKMIENKINQFNNLE